ncbi:MAG: hypothetical protein E3K29_06745 [Candidatus Brocadia sp.]|nr:hypothetical protein [Candidatus Brocadia sp.]
MNELIRIEDVEVQKIVYRDQPVLTLADIDRVHGRPEGTAKRNFNENRERFLVGKHFFELPYEEWSILVVQNSYDQEGNSSNQKEVGGHRRNKIFMTIYGYLMLTKSFKDERAWKVQEILVDSYFDLKVIQKAAQKDVEFMELQKKYIALLENTVTLLKPRTKKPTVMISDEEKKQILELHSKGVSNSEIAKQTGRSRSGVSNIINYGMTAGIQGIREQQAKQIINAAHQ